MKFFDNLDKGGLSVELKQLRYFMKVAELEHVTDAALSLDISQSAVSRQIYNLEQELGVELFYRRGRNVILTHAGKMFYEHMDRIRVLFHQAEREIREFQSPKTGTVHIGFPSSIATYIMPAVVSAFREEYPEVKFRLSQGSYYELINMVVKGQVNMALLAPLPEDERVEGEILFTEKVVALLPSSHPLASEEEIEINSLRDEEFVTFPEGYILRDLIMEACHKGGFAPDISFEGEDIETIKGMVSAGLGVSFIPEVTLVDGMPRNAVKIPLKNPVVTRSIGIVKSKERPLLPTEETFYRFLIDFFSHRR